MTFFRPAQQERRIASDALSPAALISLHSDRRNRVYSGVPVNDTTALAHSAVWACTDLIAELVSTLPVDEYRQNLSTGVLTPMMRPPLLDDPAGDGYGFEMWCRQVMVSLLMRGNFYGWVEAIGPDGWPTQVSTLHPDEIQPRRSRTSGPVEWFRNNNRVERWPAGPLWHVPAYTFPGNPVGLAPIRYAAETVGLGLATQKFGAQWFGDGAHPSSVLESDHEINQSQAELLKQRVMQSLADNRQPLVLGLGTKLNAIQVSPDESQFLQTIKANVADVCRFYRVPPEMVGGESGNSMTYSNVESRSLSLLTYTLNGWMVRVEKALSRLRPRPRVVKFNADALIRVDIKTRYDVHQIRIRNGLNNRNEIRELEDEEPIPGPEGDEYVWPPVGQGAGQDVKPPGTGGVVDESPGGSTVTPTPVPPTNGNGKTPAPAKK